uniref:Threonine--tRNA ligase n=1 Tax=uncultured marine group II/III euryarchaeote KM3_15_H06 TaxID=1457911 RepID=A0A075GIH5_9EURY|nr:threonyl-tRNA synthetase (TARS, thrS) [uncultured marine group II/III euryarchaeote KM3_15_H06]
MSTVEVTLPDGSIHDIAPGVSAGEVLRDSLGKGAVAALIDGVEVDLSTPISAACSISPIQPDSDAGLYILRHSCAHLLAQAVTQLHPDAKPTIGPPIEHGFYYDFEMEPLGEEELRAIEKLMKQLVKQNLPLTREEHDAPSLAAMFSDNSFKTEIIDEKLEAGAGSTVYRQGDFVDLCRGPHVPSTAALRWFKLTSTSTAFWRADSTRQQLVRIYGMCYANKQDLQARQTLLREAGQRDHRKLGKDLQLFHVDEMVGQGLVLWTPRGSVVRQELQDFISEHLRRQGYHQVFTPHIGKLDLYRTSGHFPYYQESQYPPLVERDLMAKLADEGCSCSDLSNLMNEGDIDGYLLKPMNCPHHIRIFSSQPRSYRDLPLRLAEFGTVYRWEQSGEISGMTRVRGFTQDDAHLFVTEKQIADEVLGCIELVEIIFGTLGMDDYRVRVGLRDDESGKYVGDAKAWEKAEAACLQAAESLGVEFTEEPGEAAFYGPKIDFVVRDVLGREWQLGTVQVDYNLPERFELEYTGSDGEKHRPVMIHRAPFGSMERFVGVLIEHFAGKFPTWLTPTQAHIITISEKHIEYANEVANALREAGVRVEVDDSDSTIGKKIRTHRKMQPAYLVVVGDDETENRTVSVRDRTGNQANGMDLDIFIANLTAEIALRDANQSIVPPE